MGKTGAGGVSCVGVAEDGEDNDADEDDFIPLLLSPSMSSDGALRGSSLLEWWVEELGTEEGVEAATAMETFWQGFFVASIFCQQGCVMVPVNGLFSALSFVGCVFLLVFGQIWDPGGSLVERLYEEAHDLLLFKAALKYSSGSHAYLSSWEKGTECCLWDDISCDNTTHIVSVDIHGLGGGVISQSLCRLTSLTIIDLSGNGLTGTLPPCLGNLSYLIKLNLNGNMLSGNIPLSFGNMSLLQYFDVSSNILGGSIPDSMGNLSSLETMQLSYNTLSGSIPDSLGNISSLRLMDLSHNSLSGSIPDSLGNLSSLETINLSYNFLSGSISDSFGNLSSLKVIDLSHNTLSGSIQHSLGNLSSLETMFLGYNTLSTRIPDSLGNLSSLELMDLSHNVLSGKIPDSLGNQFSLRTIYLNYNILGGSIRDSLDNLSTLKLIDLSHNTLSGSIPDSLGNLSALKWMDYNTLSGSILNSLSNLSSLKWMDLSRNQLNGTLPSSALPSSLEQLSLSLNGHQIISEAWFQKLGKLESPSLSDCVLNISTAWIPPFQLKALSLTSCKIHGQIPSWISTQFSLEELKLTDNNLVGEIPSWLLDMKLSYINFTTNHLEGRLLLNSSAWKGITALNMSNNALCGQIPLIWPPRIILLLLNDNLLTGNK
ncbi:probable leucine-rich repeat receptor-like protein kinase At1g35710 [Cryptomeria japonica]|uniref:probable leucine-rich repeat receptor-like protein kinase At1g35710 n=1 Tax=Cryptomeria japonica TaxID=3369 RepID=UPI0027DA34CB|nr:probable leucine-rich repeat receptor-like protein kinase At1g35710 [Cryptomeria japonica]